MKAFKGDKRTKEYQAWKTLQTPSSGLGDTIDKVTTVTGIKTAVKFFFGDDCGCEEKKELLNKKYPYLKAHLDEEEFLYLDEFFKTHHPQITSKVQNELLLIYNRVFNKRLKLSSCGLCVKKLLNSLEDLHKNYKIQILKY